MPILSFAIYSQRIVNVLKMSREILERNEHYMYTFVHLNSLRLKRKMRRKPLTRAMSTARFDNKWNVTGTGKFAAPKKIGYQINCHHEHRRNYEASLFNIRIFWRYVRCVCSNNLPGAVPCEHIEVKILYVNVIKFVAQKFVCCPLRFMKHPDEWISNGCSIRRWF